MNPSSIDVYQYIKYTYALMIVNVLFEYGATHIYQIKKGWTVRSG